uniref:Uncharacterized protein n=1 Tax=Cacopsylla melanoneura TaxID=428564 RepID=A0A8D8ZWI0_9HEMI
MGILRNLATSIGLSHDSDGVSGVGSDGQLKRWGVSCGLPSHLGHLSSMAGSIRCMYVLRCLDHPERSWARMVLVQRGSFCSARAMSGGFCITIFTSSLALCL